MSGEGANYVPPERGLSAACRLVQSTAPLIHLVRVNLSDRGMSCSDMGVFCTSVQAGFLCHLLPTVSFHLTARRHSGGSNPSLCLWLGDFTPTPADKASYCVTVTYLPTTISVFSTLGMENMAL